MVAVATVIHIDRRDFSVEFGRGEEDRENSRSYAFSTYWSGFGCNTAELLLHDETLVDEYCYDPECRIWSYQSFLIQMGIYMDDSIPCNESVKVCLQLWSRVVHAVFCFLKSFFFSVKFLTLQTLKKKLFRIINSNKVINYKFYETIYIFFKWTVNSNKVRNLRKC